MTHNYTYPLELLKQRRRKLVTQFANDDHEDHPTPGRCPYGYPGR